MAASRVASDRVEAGFDVETKLLAGAPTTIPLSGKQPGLYEVETHETPLRLLMVAVR